MFLFDCYMERKIDRVLYKKRNDSQTYSEKIIASSYLKFLYGSLIGYPFLKLLTGNQFVSYLYGKLMTTKYSRHYISKFVKEYNINTEEIEKSLDKFSHFNDFFYRKLKPLSRKIDNSIDSIISPSDGKILVYDNAQEILIKNQLYTLDNLIQNKSIADKYKNCSIAIIRLAPTDYHRFHFPCDGYVSNSTLINGKYFSVSPIALKFNPNIFFQNKRTYNELSSKKFGNILIMEIGATMVGSIKHTYQPESFVNKGDEKGYFEFGGSTLVLLFDSRNIIFDKDILINSKNNYETQIFMGEKIGSYKTEEGLTK